MALQHDYIGDIKPDKLTWRIKVRIIRTWKKPSSRYPYAPVTLEMVLIDEKGKKIEALVRKPLINKFSSQIKDGELRTISNFDVCEDSGDYRHTDHAYKIIFLFETTVKPCDDVNIPLHGFSFVPFDNILSNNKDDKFLIDDPIAFVVGCTYPSIVEKMWDSDYFQERAILAPTHEVVEDVNEYLLNKIPGVEKIYLSSDSICKSDTIADCNQDMYSLDYLNTLRCSGLPNHRLRLKVGVPVMLLRNLDQSSGLCNGTRMIITQLGDHMLKAKIITGTNVGKNVAIPRMLLSPSDSRLPFKFQRRQFPLVVCFAMTINKSQGQSLSQVGLYLPRPVFSHGHLHVAMSRVKSKKGLKVLIVDKDGRNKQFNDQRSL